MSETVAALQRELPGVGVVPAGAARFEVTIADALDAGYETHFARTLDEFLTTLDDHRWPAALPERTPAKYTLLAEASARTSAEHATPMEESR